ncbi:MAG TPA: methyltransferase domain-containing protein [Stellaceae bacterium]|nr:methyltransferase domain-containing protein [Stellaceae bacterium]
MGFDPDELRAFEHAGWQKAAAYYASTFAAATGEFAAALLDAAGAGPGMRLLDLCCGTGLIAAAAAARGAIAAGLDFSPAMLAEARAVRPELDFREGDAEAMPFPGDSFDAVVSSFGIHHVPRPARALAEAQRVLRPGGRIAFATWAAPSENTAWRLLLDAIKLHGDPDAAQAPVSGGGIGSAAAVRRLLQDAGFADHAVRPVRREWRLAHPGDLIAALRRGTVRTAALIDAQRPAALAAIEAEIARQAAAYRRDGWYCIPIAAILGSGTKP